MSIIPQLNKEKGGGRYNCRELGKGVGSIGEEGRDFPKRLSQEKS